MSVNFSLLLYVLLVYLKIWMDLLPCMICNIIHWVLQLYHCWHISLTSLATNNVSCSSWSNWLILVKKIYVKYSSLNKHSLSVVLWETVFHENGYCIVASLVHNHKSFQCLSWDWLLWSTAAKLYISFLFYHTEF
jgi:hypothetical protein